jgi:RNA-binding motif protein, X-linked 2
MAGGRWDGEEKGGREIETERERRREGDRDRKIEKEGGR